LPRPVIGTSYGRRALFVDGVVQSVDPDDAASGYWNAMIPDDRPASALLLGVGGGTIAQLLTRKFGPLPITGVDESSDVLEVAREQFGLTLPDLTLVQADAFVYVHHTEDRFDFIAVDLYRGNRLVGGVLALAVFAFAGGAARAGRNDRLQPVRRSKTERARGAAGAGV